MTPERWQRIQELFHAALRREPDQRTAYLQQACAGDEGLRREVESLLIHGEETKGFLEAPPIEVPAKMLGEDSGFSLVGRQLGCFQVLSLLGAGGMGEVYQAYDSKLERDVAIKVLPEAFAHDPERLSRFQREAKMLAAMNHPNIATIFGLEHSDGVQYLVMELVSGETLAERVKAGPLGIEEALKIAGQIAEALEAAHEKSIIHRDLKPANVKVTQDGRVKVLDFGLAKAFVGDGGPDFSDAATLTAVGTEEGRILGTPSYMSPEQARGKPVDKRTDIWAFGCVLYELLTAKRAFRGEAITDTLVAVLEREPDWNALSSSTPAKIRELLRRCLEKDSQRRLRDIGDARMELEALIASSKPWRRNQAAIWITAVTILGSVMVGGVMLLRSNKPSVPTLQYTQLTDFADSVSSPALSPDGRLLAFKRGANTFDGPGEIYVKLLPNGDPVQLTHDGLSKMSPVFSPDGSRIAYTVPWNTWIVPVLGGAPELMLPNSSGLTWLDPQHILFSEITKGIYMKVATSAESRADERDVYLPKTADGMAHRSYLSPNHRWVLVAEMGVPAGWQPCRLVPFDGSSHGKPVGPSSAACTSAAWSPDGHWMYFSADTGSGFHLWQQHFPDGAPQQLTFGVTEEEGIAVSPDGRSLIAAVGAKQSTVWLHDRSGERQVSSEGYALSPMISPNGEKIYYLVRSGAPQAFVAGELWAADVIAGHLEKVLPGFFISRYDISSDGKRIVFAAYDGHGNSTLWLAAVDRRFPPRQLTSVSEPERPFFSPDGAIFFLRREGESSYVYRMNADGTEQEKVIVRPVIYLLGVSPDGQWIIAWTAKESKESEETSQAIVVYSTGGGPAKLICDNCSATGPSYQGTSIVSWSPDQRFLYLRIGFKGLASRKTFVIPLRTGEALPKLPSSGIRSESDLLALPGARVIDQGDRFPGPDAFTYTFMRNTTQRNLYRVQLP